MPSATTAKPIDLPIEVGPEAQTVERKVGREAASGVPRTQFRPVEERVAVLEAIQVTKDDLRAAEGRISRLLWTALLGVVVPVLVAVAGSFLVLQSNQNSTAARQDTRIDHLSNDLKDEIRATNARINRLEERMEARFKEIDARFKEQDAQFEKIDARFKEQDARFERLEAEIRATHEKIDARFDALMAAIREQQRDPR